jgi:hypothetical protein
VNMPNINAHPRHQTRRNLLRAFGATALVAQFLRGGLGGAAPGVIPNLLVVTWPDGLETGWQPKGSGTAYEFVDVLAPLNPFRSKMIVINGLKGGCSNLILQHSEGPYSLWTGAKPKGFEDISPIPSIDQIVAAKIGGGTPYRSLHFGTQSNRPSAICKPYTHFAGPKQPIPAEDDPNAMYKLLFGGMALPAGGAERLRAERKSVLDFVTGRLGALRTQVSATDRVKLDKHEEAVRAMERGLDGVNKTCGTGMISPLMTKAAAMADQNFPAVIKLQTDLAVTALQCGATKVATLQISNTDSQVKIPGVSTTRTVHDAMHGGTTPERVDINRFFAKQLAYVLERMQAVDVGGGRTLLDNTLVVMGTEMAVGGHWNDPVPFFLAGAGGTDLKMGRYVNLANKPQHTKLLTSVVRAMGVDVQTVGEFTASDATGELAELRG